MRAFLFLLLSGALLASMSPAMSPARAEDADWRKVDEMLGRTAAVSGEVHRYTFPRSDLSVTLDGVALKPALGVGSWLAFKPAHGDGEAMAMGDLVLLESEVGPVTAKLLERGWEITAMHNHLIRTTPTLVYTHVAGAGEPVKLAAALREALALSRTPLTAPAAAPAQTTELDTAQLEQIIGAQGKAEAGVYQFAVPRRGQIREGETPLTPPVPLGAATTIYFQPAGGGKAAVAGDFALTADEVNAVIRTLRSNGIEVTAVHNHMISEQPRLVFVHFWGSDDAQKLAKAVRAALDKVDTGRT